MLLFNATHYATLRGSDNFFTISRGSAPCGAAPPGYHMPPRLRGALG